MVFAVFISVRPSRNARSTADWNRFLRLLYMVYRTSLRRCLRVVTHVWFFCVIQTDSGIEIYLYAPSMHIVHALTWPSLTWPFCHGERMVSGCALFMSLPFLALCWTAGHMRPPSVYSRAFHVNFRDVAAECKYAKRQAESFSFSWPFPNFLRICEQLPIKKKISGEQTLSSLHYSN